jgi:hypothetical protein
MWVSVAAGLALLAWWLVFGLNRAQDGSATTSDDFRSGAPSEVRTDANTPSVAAMHRLGEGKVRIEGHVIDPAGLQVEGAIVETWIPADLRDASRACRAHAPTVEARVESDSDGVFELMMDKGTQHCIRASDGRRASSEPQILDQSSQVAGSLRLILRPSTL